MLCSGRDHPDLAGRIAHASRLIHRDRCKHRAKVRLQFRYEQYQDLFRCQWCVNVDRHHCRFTHGLSLVNFWCRYVNNYRFNFQQLLPIIQQSNPRLITFMLFESIKEKPCPKNLTPCPKHLSKRKTTRKSLSS